MGKSKITIRDVAKEANVSVASVSYVLNNVNKVSEETRNKVLEVIEKMNYKPDVIARKLAKQEKSLIGIVMPIKESYKKTILTDNPFYQEFISGVEYCSRQNGLNTVMIAVDNAGDAFNKIDINSLLGVIALGYIEEELCQKIYDLNIPVVLIDQKKDNFDFITLSSDDTYGGYIATEYLIKQGHKKIAFLSGELEGCYVHNNRFCGYLKALKQNNLNFNQQLIFESEVTYEGGINAAEKIYERLDEISAVFCISDIIALGLIKGLLKKGIQVPERLSVIGFDDIKPSKYFNPELTTIRQHIFLKGEKAVELLVDNNKQSISGYEYILPVTLIERESVENYE